MSKRDFFIIMIRLFGLYSAVITVFTFVPQSGQWIWVIQNDGAIAFVVMVVGFAIAVGLLWMLIRKAPSLVSALKLDSGFDEEQIDLVQLRPAGILAIGTFVVGGLLFVDNAPRFLSSSYFAFKDSIAGFDYMAQDRTEWGIQGLNVIVGYLLVAHHQWIANKLSK